MALAHERLLHAEIGAQKAFSCLCWSGLVVFSARRSLREWSCGGTAGQVFLPSYTYRFANEVLSFFSHGLTRKASTIFLFVSIRQGFPFSILCRVITDKLVLLASSDLLIRSFSRSALSGFSVGIFTTPFPCYA